MDEHLIEKIIKERINPNVIGTGTLGEGKWVHGTIKGTDLTPKKDSTNVASELCSQMKNGFKGGYTTHLNTDVIVGGGHSAEICNVKFPEVKFNGTESKS